MENTAPKAASGYDRVFTYIRDRLLSGEWKRGDVLLPERELCRLLDVSRPVVREALRALAIMGVIDIRHGVGSVVSSPDMAVLGDFFSFALADNADAVEEVVEARIAIECQAARLAVSRASITDFERLRMCADVISQTIGSPAEGARADFEFHRALVDASAAAALKTMYVAVADLLQRSHADRRALVAADEAVRQQVVDDHYKILRTLTEGDPDAAERAVREHFEIGRRIRMQHSIARS